LYVYIYTSIAAAKTSLQKSAQTKIIAKQITSSITATTKSICSLVFEHTKTVERQIQYICRYIYTYMVYDMHALVSILVFIYLQSYTIV